jgi:hypothetical protein
MKRSFASTIFALSFLVLSVTEARADLSQKQARKAIATMAGLSLPNSAVRVGRIVMTSNSVAETTAELEMVFRFSQQREGYWRLQEVRTGQDRWEQLDMLAQAAKVELPGDHCDFANQFLKTPIDLTPRQARCLVASLFGVKLPSDAVRIKNTSSLGLPLGSEPSALAVALIRVDFRLEKNRSGWQVSECKSGDRSWMNVTGISAQVDQIKRSFATREMDLIAKALDAFRRDRGTFVISDKQAVLIDHLSPHYLTRVIRLDPWSRPYEYQGDRDHFSLRSNGPDGKSGTADDVLFNGPNR